VAKARVKHASSNPPGTGNGGIAPPVETRWKPGECPNPSGRPRTRPITHAIRAALDEHDGDAIKRIARTAVKRAMGGDYRFAAEILERIDGPVPQVTEDATGRPTYEDFLLKLEEAAHAERERVQGLGKGPADADDSA